MTIRFSDGNGLRVAMVVNGFPDHDRPHRGVFNLRAARSLRRYVDLQVIFLRTWTPRRRRFGLSEYEGVPVATIALPHLPWPTGLNLWTYARLGWPLVERVLRTCHLVHSVDVSFPGILACDWAARAGIRHVTQVISEWSLVQKSALAALARRTNAIHGVACNSWALRAHFSALFPSVQNVRTVWRGVDLDRFTPIGPTAGPMASLPPVRYLFLGGIPTGPRVNDSSGDPVKGGDLLLKAWRHADAARADASASLLIVGPGALSDRVQRWRAALRSPERVHLSNLVHPEQIASYVRAADAVLIPSEKEGLPNVAMEASACGIPVLGSRIGGIVDVVADGETGVLIPPTDAVAWGDALLSFAGQIAHLRALGGNARRRMVEQFDCQGYPLEMLDVYRAAGAVAPLAAPA